MTEPMLTRRAPGAASTWDPDTWTVSVTLSTGAGVERADARGPFVELLDLAGARWPERIPLLDAHGRESVDRQLGYVTGIERVGGELRGIAHLSRNNPRSQRIAADLQDGHGFGISVGYAVGGWSERANNGRREKVATAWTIVEASLVPIPADAASGTRGAPMENENNDPARSSATETRPADNAGLYRIAEAAGLTRAWTDEQIQAGADAQAIALAAVDAMQERTRPAATIRATGHNQTTLDDPQNRARAQSDAIVARILPGHQPSEPARQFVGMTIRDHAAEACRYNGIATTGLSASAVVSRALHSTSDFPLILGDTVGRVMRTAYQAAPSGLKRVARQVSLPDFRPRNRLQTSQFSALEKVGEHGEFKRGSFQESGESIRLATFGRVFGITRQALVNDDLSAFADIPRRLGVAAAAFEAQQLADLLLAGSGAGPIMSDGNRLFHASHGNLMSAVDWLGVNPPTEYGLDVARKSMRAQTDASGQLISVTPRFLIVGPELETLAEKILASIQAAAIADVNVCSGRLSLVVEPRISGKAWYICADPSEIDGLEFAYLEGEAGPQIETRAGFDVDGVETRIRLDFGCGFADWRGWLRNPGA